MLLIDKSRKCTIFYNVRVFSGIAIFLVFSIVSCHLSPSNEDSEPPLYTDDGRPMKTFTINTVHDPSSKALTPSTARSSITLYEAAFQDGSGNVYRAVWPYTRTGKITLPIGNYTAAGSAIMFAGRQSDRTLFAVGSLAAGNGNITPNTSTITFTLSALTNDVNNINTPQRPSSFQITNTAAAALPAIMEIFKNNIKAPVFKIPWNNSSVTAVYGIGGIDAGHLQAMYYPGGAKVFSKAIETSSPPYLNGVELVMPGTGFTITTNFGILTSSNFSLNLYTPAKEGHSVLTFEIPLKAISDTNHAITWFIRGGSENELLDAGIGSDDPPVNPSIGGSVVVLVYDDQAVP